MERFKFWLLLCFKLATIVEIIRAIPGTDWIRLGSSVETLILLLLPTYVMKKLGLRFTAEFEAMLFFFFFSAQYFGELKGFYISIWWWDVFVHGLSAMILGAVGFSIARILMNQESCDKSRSLFVCLFSFCFTLAVGAVWEIHEFAMDAWFGMNMQKSGLVDTMWDLIVDALGALIFSIFGYFYLKGGVPFVARFLERRACIERQAPRPEDLVREEKCDIGSGV